jgi:hypothetical protein
MNTVEFGVIEPLCTDGNDCDGCVFIDTNLTGLDGKDIGCYSVDCRGIIWIKSNTIGVIK